MRFRFSEEQEEFRKEVREFLAQEREKLKGEPVAEFPYQFYSDVGKTGWIGVSCPEEYGGQGRSPVYQAIFLDEALLGAPEPVWTAAFMSYYIGSFILDRGSEDLKRRFLPATIAGQFKLAGGYTEPDAGSDYGGIQTRAVADGDHYVLNGTKLYNDAYLYEYMLTSARTDPKAARDEGTTMFMVDLNGPGVTINPIWTMWGFRRNEVVLEDVIVPKEDMVGAEGKGCEYLMTTGRDYEWALMGTPAQLKRSLDVLVRFVKQTKREGQPLSDFPSVRYQLADLALEIQIADLIYYKAFWMMEQGMPMAAASAMTKLYTSELMQRFYNAMIDITGQYGQLERTAATKKLAPMGGMPSVFYKFAPSQAIAGWTTEMQRNQIAIMGLELPSA